MKKIKKISLFIIVLIFLVGVVNATENIQKDQTITDETATTNTNTISQHNKIINNEKNTLINENPQKTINKTTHNIKKKTNTNLKKENIIEVHNYTELQTAVNNASNTGNSRTNTTIRLLGGSYNNTGTISWWTNNNTLTIDGNGQTINGHQQQVFLISANTTMNLKNITITNATGEQGGAINNFGNLNITDSTFTNNNASEGGGIRNEGILNIINSIFINNTAVTGGAINDKTDDNWTNIISSYFINNTANQGAAIQARGWVNLTNNTFKENTATKIKETIELFGYYNGIFKDNTYESTDVALNEIKLTIHNNQSNPKSIDINYSIKPTNSHYYKDFETGLNDITLYINGEKNKTTKYENTTLTDLQAGKYEAYFTSCNRQSNTVTFKITGDSQITTPEKSYEYYKGINNKIPLLITDASGEKGNITITVKDQDTYKQLSTYHNIGNNHQLPTESLVHALENLYNPLNDSYIINVTYDSDCANPSSTEFTLNINKQRNTTITYNILNNTEGNVQINITVQDTIHKTPITDANIQITGAITQNTTTGIITDKSLTPGEYTIKVNYNENSTYTASNTTINFNVEIDKDKKIKELEEYLKEANKNIDELNKNLTQANQKNKEQNNKINNLTTANNNLNKQLDDANKKIDALTKQNAELEKQLTDLKQKVDTLTKTVDNLNKTVAARDNTIKELTTKVTTKITVTNINSTKYTNTVTVTGKVTDKNGKALNNMPVSIKINTGTTKAVTNANGVYKYTTSAWSVGTSNVTVSAIANDKYTSSTAKTTFKVSKAKPVLKLNSISAVKYKDKVTVTGSLKNSANKAISSATLSLKINTKTVTVKTSKDGSFTYKTTATKMGTNNVTVTYAGNTKYNKVTKETTFKVAKQNLILTVDRVASGLKYKDPLVIGGRLVDGNNKAVANSQVSLKFNGKTYKAKTDKNGYYKVTTRATTMDKNNLTVTYNGNKYYNKATAKTTFTVAKQDIVITFNTVKYSNGKVTISGTFTDRNRHALMNSLARITLNGKQGTAKTDKTGTFTYTTKANKGTYKVTLAYPGNARYNAYSKTTTVKTA